MSRKLQTPEFELGLELDGTVNDRPENKDKTQALIEAAEQEKARMEHTKKSLKAQDEISKKSQPSRTKGYYLSEENHKWIAKEALRLSLDGDDRVTASSLLEDIINKYRGKSL
jgi:hypothetical protein